ncbi:MAG: flagellar biosynthesis protein FliC [Gammaproteobacteria bacterium]|nr:flagellar biosynthesis protein FliC [Gammaproteobacteria bacterium]
MPLVINTNVAALSSQRQLIKSGLEQDQAMERLSSGKRVNTAADDAAGLAIANRMTSQILGLNQAVRNSNDGISLMQTAEGALEETTSILQRMRELAIQSANGIYSDADRSTLDAEVQQLKAEIDRIAETTTFNGQPLLDGSLTNLELQVGSEANQTVSLEVGSLRATSLGGNGGNIVGEATVNGLADLTALAAGDIVVNGVSNSELTATSSVKGALALLNADFESAGVEVSSLVSFTASGVGDGQLVAGTDTMVITVVDGDRNSSTYTLSGTKNLAELVDKINSDTSVTATLDDTGKMVLSQQGVESIAVNDSTSGNATGVSVTTANNFSLVFSDGEAGNMTIVNGGLSNAEVLNLGVSFTDARGNQVGTTITDTGSTVINEGDLMINGVAVGAFSGAGTVASSQANAIAAINDISSQTGVVAFAATATTLGLRSTSGAVISVEYGGGANQANMIAVTGLQEQNAASGSGSIAGISIDTAAGAQNSIDVLDSALEEINAIRADIGAITNRLEHTISNLMNVSENTSASRSRIMDADFAAETANLSRAQVLQQASQAMLAQANAQPQQVLQLLNG